MKKEPNSSTAEPTITLTHAQLLAVFAAGLAAGDKLLKYRRSQAAIFINTERAKVYREKLRRVVQLFLLLEEDCHLVDTVQAHISAKGLAHYGFKRMPCKDKIHEIIQEEKIRTIVRLFSLHEEDNRLVDTVQAYIAEVGLARLGFKQMPCKDKIREIIQEEKSTPPVSAPHE